MFNDKFWVIGGKDDDSKKDWNDVWVSTDGANWTQATASAPWKERDTHCAVVFKDKMWILGGFSADPTGVHIELLNDVWSSPDGKNWTCATPKAPWQERFAFQTVVINNKMWVIGGFGDGPNGEDKSFNDVWYSEDGAKWTQATPLAAPWAARDGHGAVVFDNKIWISGGWGLSDVWYCDMPVGVEKSVNPAQEAGRARFTTTIVPVTGGGSVPLWGVSAGKKTTIAVFGLSGVLKRRGTAGSRIVNVERDLKLSNGVYIVRVTPGR